MLIFHTKLNFYMNDSQNSILKYINLLQIHDCLISIKKKFSNDNFDYSMSIRFFKFIFNKIHSIAYELDRDLINNVEILVSQYKQNITFGKSNMIDIPLALRKFIFEELKIENKPNDNEIKDDFIVKDKECYDEIITFKSDKYMNGDSPNFLSISIPNRQSSNFFNFSSDENTKANENQIYDYKNEFLGNLNNNENSFFQELVKKELHANDRGFENFCNYSSKDNENVPNMKIDDVPENIINANKVNQNNIIDVNFNVFNNFNQISNNDIDVDLVTFGNYERGESDGSSSLKNQEKKFNSKNEIDFQKHSLDVNEVNQKNYNFSLLFIKIQYFLKLDFMRTCVEFFKKFLKQSIRLEKKIRDFHFCDTLFVKLDYLFEKENYLNFINIIISILYYDSNKSDILQKRDIKHNHYYEIPSINKITNDLFNIECVNLEAKNLINENVKDDSNSSMSNLDQIIYSIKGETLKILLKLMKNLSLEDVKLDLLVEKSTETIIDDFSNNLRINNKSYAITHNKNLVNFVKFIKFLIEEFLKAFKFLLGKTKMEDDNDNNKFINEIFQSQYESNYFNALHFYLLKVFDFFIYSLDMNNKDITNIFSHNHQEIYIYILVPLLKRTNYESFLYLNKPNDYFTYFQDNILENNDESLKAKIYNFSRKLSIVSRDYTIFVYNLNIDIILFHILKNKIKKEKNDLLFKIKKNNNEGFPIIELDIDYNQSEVLTRLNTYENFIKKISLFHSLKDTTNITENYKKFNINDSDKESFYLNKFHESNLNDILSYFFPGLKFTYFNIFSNFNSYLSAKEFQFFRNSANQNVKDDSQNHHGIFNFDSICELLKNLENSIFSDIYEIFIEDKNFEANKKKLKTFFSFNLGEIFEISCHSLCSIIDSLFEIKSLSSKFNMDLRIILEDIEKLTNSKEEITNMSFCYLLISILKKELPGNIALADIEKKNLNNKYYLDHYINYIIKSFNKNKISNKSNSNTKNQIIIHLLNNLFFPDIFTAINSAKNLQKNAYLNLNSNITCEKLKDNKFDLYKNDKPNIQIFDKQNLNKKKNQIENENITKERSRPNDDFIADLYYKNIYETNNTAFIYNNIQNSNKAEGFNSNADMLKFYSIKKQNFYESRYLNFDYEAITGIKQLKKTNIHNNSINSEYESENENESFASVKNNDGLHSDLHQEKAIFKSCEDHKEVNEEDNNLIYGKNIKYRNRLKPNKKSTIRNSELRTYLKSIFFNKNDLINDIYNNHVKLKDHFSQSIPFENFLLNLIRFSYDLIEHNMFIINRFFLGEIINNIDEKYIKKKRNQDFQGLFIEKYKKKIRDNSNKFGYKGNKANSAYSNILLLEELSIKAIFHKDIIEKRNIFNNLKALFILLPKIVSSNYEYEDKALNIVNLYLNHIYFYYKKFNVGSFDEKQINKFLLQVDEFQNTFNKFLESISLDSYRCLNKYYINIYFGFFKVIKILNNKINYLLEQKIQKEKFLNDKISTINNTRNLYAEYFEEDLKSSGGLNNYDALSEENMIIDEDDNTIFGFFSNKNFENSDNKILNSFNNLLLTHNFLILHSFDFYFSHLKSFFFPNISNDNLAINQKAFSLNTNNDPFLKAEISHIIIITFIGNILENWNILEFEKLDEISKVILIIVNKKTLLLRKEYVNNLNLLCHLFIVKLFTLFSQDISSSINNFSSNSFNKKRSSYKKLTVNKNNNNNNASINLAEYLEKINPLIKFALNAEALGFYMENIISIFFSLNLFDYFLEDLELNIKDDVSFFNCLSENPEYDFYNYNLNFGNSFNKGEGVNLIKSKVMFLISIYQFLVERLAIIKISAELEQKVRGCSYQMLYEEKELNYNKNIDILNYLNDNFDNMDLNIHRKRPKNPINKLLDNSYISEYENLSFDNNGI